MNQKEFDQRVEEVGMFEVCKEAIKVKAELDQITAKDKMFKTYIKEHLEEPKDVEGITVKVQSKSRWEVKGDADLGKIKRKYGWNAFKVDATKLAKMGGEDYCFKKHHSTAVLFEGMPKIV